LGGEERSEEELATGTRRLNDANEKGAGKGGEIAKTRANRRERGGNSGKKKFYLDRRFARRRSPQRGEIPARGTINKSREVNQKKHMTAKHCTKNSALGGRRQQVFQQLVESTTTIYKLP